MAEQYYAKKKYNQAQILFEELFPIVKGTPQFEDLYYKYAYCAYYQRDYMNAENLFKNFAEVFPNSPKAEEMDYMRALHFITIPKGRIGSDQYHKSNRPDADFYQYTSGLSKE